VKRRADRAVGVVCACLLLAGCGDEAPAGGSSQPAPATAASAPIRIARPLDGTRLRASQTPGGRLRAAARVRGRAQPGGAVFLSAGCRPARCQARATAGKDGAWAVSMRLTTTRAARFVTIDASSRPGVSATGSDVTTVELAGPRRASTASTDPAQSRGRSTGSGPRSGSPGATAAAPPPPAAGQALPHDVLVIGDSLALGMADALRVALPGWRVRVDAKISRPLAEGMRILAREPDVPAVVAFSLFTNDDPGATAALEQAVRATATRPGGCAVWATIVRPPYNGVSYAAANRLLQRLGSDPQLRLRLVDWAGLIARSPSFVAGDGVHGTPESYRARGALYAQAIKSCAR
jgi:hypothetical protein